jgi:hypothetical protein
MSILWACDLYRPITHYAKCWRCVVGKRASHSGGHEFGFSTGNKYTYLVIVNFRQELQAKALVHS